MAHRTKRNVMTTNIDLTKIYNFYYGTIFDMIKVMVKLFLCLNKYHIIKTYAFFN